MHVQEPFENTQWRKVEQIRTMCISVIGDVVRVQVHCLDKPAGIIRCFVDLLLTLILIHYLKYEPLF